MAKKAPSDLSFETGMLAFARSLQITEGLFFGLSHEDDQTVRVPIEIREKGVRGQTSQDNAKDKAGLSNPQSVEFAVVPQGCHAISLEFSLRVLPMSRQPHACDNTDVGSAYRRLAAAYDAAQGYDVLAALYVWNIANGRFAWRNRFQADTMSVMVAFDGRTITFDPLSLGFDEMPDRDTMVAAITAGDASDYDALVSGIARGLAEAAFSMKVSWVANMESGQEVFPSQEYVRSEKADDALSRVLAKLPTTWRGRTVLQASMHSQKIGAALRHIDVWHDTDGYGAIAVNPYGGVQETSAVLRAPGTKKSFYDLRKNAEAVLTTIEGATAPSDIPGEIHFLMANLVRGGVLGKSSKGSDA
mgnify:FL=1|jgi:CRISPR-associated protein Csy3|tara:strand:- start:45166 stop:46242 length:1077 start_codon:yes stop_codon:yes gene_type:complete